VVAFGLISALVSKSFTRKSSQWVFTDQPSMRCSVTIFGSFGIYLGFRRMCILWCSLLILLFLSGKLCC